MNFLYLISYKLKLCNRSGTKYVISSKLPFYQRAMSDSQQYLLINPYYIFSTKKMFTYQKIDLFILSVYIIRFSEMFWKV